MNEQRIPVWVSDYGVFVIPPELRDVPIRADGWVDKRYARAAELLEWVAEQEANADL